MNTTFKPGDLVFEVYLEKGVQLSRLEDSKSKSYPVVGDFLSYQKDGCCPPNILPTIFHATPENQLALTALYGKEAIPELPLQGSDLTKKLLETQEYVLAWLSDICDQSARGWCRYLGVVSAFEDVDGEARFYDQARDEWRCYAVPVNPVTGEEITELSANSAYSDDLKPGDVLLRKDEHKYFTDGARYIVTAERLQIEGNQGG